MASCRLIIPSFVSRQNRAQIELAFSHPEAGWQVRVDFLGQLRPPMAGCIVERVKESYCIVDIVGNCISESSFRLPCPHTLWTWYIIRFVCSLATWVSWFPPCLGDFRTIFPYILYWTHTLIPSFSPSCHFSSNITGIPIQADERMKKR